MKNEELRDSNAQRKGKQTGSQTHQLNAFIGSMRETKLAYPRISSSTFSVVSSSLNFAKSICFTGPFSSSIVLSVPSPALPSQIQ